VFKTDLLVAVNNLEDYVFIFMSEAELRPGRQIASCGNSVVNLPVVVMAVPAEVEEVSLIA